MEERKLGNINHAILYIRIKFNLCKKGKIQRGALHNDSSTARSSTRWQVNKKYWARELPVAESPGIPVRSRGQKFNFSRSYLQRILTKYIHVRAYKVKLNKKLKPINHAHWREFVEWIQGTAKSGYKLIFRGETHFYLDGFVNRYLGFRKPTSYCWETIKSTRRHCLIRILCWSHHPAILLRKCSC